MKFPIRRVCAYCGNTRFGLVSYTWRGLRFCKAHCKHNYQLDEEETLKLTRWQRWLYGSP